MKTLPNSGAPRARQLLGQATRLPLLGAAMLGTLFLGNVAAHAVSTTVVISEFRFRGSAGASDELIELYNLSDAPVNIGGYLISGSSSTGAVSTRATVPMGTTLQPGQHFLATGSAYNDGVVGDVTFATGIADTGGVALLLPSGTIVDQAGVSTGSAYQEGTPLTSLGATNADQSYERNPGGAAGNKTDTDDNFNDFTATASTPQNLASPVTPNNGQPTNPTGVGTANPASVDQGAITLLTVVTTPGTVPTSTGLTVTGDLTGIGGSATQQFFDDGTNGDVTANNGTYSYTATVPVATTPGTKVLPVTVADAQTRSSRADISLTVNQVFPASTTIVISEFRSRGAGGGPSALMTTGDEFVELYNLSNAPVDISGFTIQYSSGTGSTPSIRATIGSGITLPAGQRYLLAATGGPLAAQANATFSAFIADNGGIGLFDASGNRVDAVGLSSVTQLKEGTALASFPTDNDPANRSYERLPLTVNNQDTQNNVADFQLTTSNPQSLNTAPNFPAASYTAGLNDALSIQLTATDPDGDTLTYSSANLPAGLSLSASGLLTGTPAAAGNFLFQVTVDDGRGGTATANIFIAVRDVPAGSDTLGPVLTHNALPKSLTRAELANFTVTGTVRDVAPGTITPAGVRRVLVNLRTGDNQQAYNGSEFTTNLNRGYYIATQTGDATDPAAPLNYSRSLAFVPTNLPAGAYILVLYPQDLAGNYSAEFLQFTVTAPAAPAATQSPDVNSGGAS